MCVPQEVIDSVSQEVKQWKEFMVTVLVINCEFPAGLALASGLAATTTITHLLKSGDGIVCMDDVYGGKKWPHVA